MVKLLLATKAFIVRDGKVLVLKESTNYEDGTNAGKYDLVGGRIKPGEQFREGLTREIKEETGLNIRIYEPFFVDEWKPMLRGEQLHIVGIFFKCLTDSGKVVLSNEHSDFKWIDPNEYKEHGLIENLFPAFEKFIKHQAL